MREDWLTRRKQRLVQYVSLSHLAGLLICAVGLVSLGRNLYLTNVIIPFTGLGLVICLFVAYWAMALYLHKDLLPDLGLIKVDQVAYAVLAAAFVLVLLLPAGDDTYLKPLLLVPVIIAAVARGRSLGVLTAFVAGGSLVLSGLFLPLQEPGLSQVFETNLIFISLALLIGWFIGGLSHIELAPELSAAQSEKNGVGPGPDLGPRHHYGANYARLQQEMTEHGQAEAILQAQLHIYQMMVGVLKETVVLPTQGYKGIRTLADLTASIQQTGYEEVVAERALQVACDITGAASGFYFSYDESDGSVFLGGAAGMAGWLTSGVCNALKEIIKQHYESLLAGRPSRSSLHLPDLLDDPEWRMYKTADVRSCYLVPLYYGERSFGLYALLSNITGGFSRERQALADTVASFISTALENARLFGEAQRAYERLKYIQQQLFQAQKLEAVGRLAAGVAHELNNQLSVIQACTDLYCQRSDQDEAVFRSFLKIGKAAKVSANLTRQLLFMGRQVPQHKSPLSLNEILIDLSDSLGDVLSSRQLALDMDLEEGIWEVNADRTNVEQVIINLAINARDAMPQGGVITIKTRNLVLDSSSTHYHGASRTGRFAMLSVTDTGTGMDEETKSRIFEPFFTTKELGKGTGLGLAVAYGIVQNHDGWIDVRSQQNQGSCFSVFLPARN